ncbi:FAD-binding oxidoreductase [Microvirga pudoricolor]|uniref:FAD-binding oxidoreductase n=1 Tax=Microvirga pudoricolor TaxID=2778729 RepID=UPI001951C184|nr:FAD-binding oxidoreductase [Microvirga pudoricolor]MBM6595315.1 FAD-binding oxidoreductase [Microvirga pudoricolor]
MGIAEGFIDRLTQFLGPKGILTGPGDLEPYTVDWRKLFPGRAACVVRPASTKQVAEVVQICRENAVPIVPQGGNTSLAGGAVPDASGTQIVLSLARMAAIRSVDAIGLTMEVEAGCVLTNAQNAAAVEGRLLPVSLASEGSATIGGIVAANAGGVNVLRYGMTRNLVLGLEIVLPDGTIVNGLRHLRKNNAGYDWRQIFVGSEGTLGIVTAAVLRLLPRPKHSVVALLSVADPKSSLELLALAQEELGDQISAFELVSAASLNLVSKHSGLKVPVAAGEWFVLMEAASSLSGLKDGAEAMLGIAFEREIVLDGVIAESAGQASELWALREHVTECEAREGKSLKHDISVPLSAIPDFLRATGQALAAGFPEARVNAFGHLGDGNIHYNVLVDEGLSSEAITRIVHDTVASFGGSITAEHGIGQYRVRELARYSSPSEMALLSRLKHVLDPQGLLNPGKVLLR